jgi:phage/plasmid-associated DNA primase
MAFVLKGESKAGKAQILTVFRGLVPEDARCSIAPGQFSQQHLLAKLAGSLLNTYDELGTTYAITSEVFKAVITGDPVTACLKYANAFTFTPTAQHIFACNLLPSFRGGMDRAVLNRLFILQIDHAIPEEERIEDLGERIVAEEMDLLLAWAIDGASRLFREKGFPRLESAEIELAEWAESDIVAAWARGRIERVPHVGVVEADGSVVPVRLTTKALYDAFKLETVAAGHEPKSIPAINVFSQRVRMAGFKWKRDSGFRGFEGVKFKRSPEEERVDRMAAKIRLPE